MVGSQLARNDWKVRFSAATTDLIHNLMGNGTLVMKRRRKRDTLVVFHTELGWIGMLGGGNVLKRLTIGHSTKEDAVAALGAETGEEWAIGRWNESLRKRLADYASGKPDDFCDVEVDLGATTEFRRRVMQCCREIPIGQTVTYGQLASMAGSERAARAVGRCMAANRVPLIVPCHRVVAANGELGGYSAQGGIRLKQKILRLEKLMR